ncbi:MAG: tryptophan synthase subunit alpha [Phycisphaerales bacterium]|jgi:tryptophan synthase alpha chain|nr:tryptophan synthase subunit alpha [Phycisphaeraceae bacterium]
MSLPLPADALRKSIFAAKERHGIALVPYITAGFPTRAAFPSLLRTIAPHAAAIEVGVPFSDPMADGMTIQNSSRIALQNGATLRWIIDQLASIAEEPLPPRVLMSYLNPLMSLGGERELAEACVRASVSALIIPDLPLEECGGLRSTLNARGIGLVQMATPITPAERLRGLISSCDGFLYAVTVTGVTGGSTPAGTPTSAPGSPAEYLRRLRSLASPANLPVCAGFGIRTRENVGVLAGLADGAIIGSALIDALSSGHAAGRDAGSDAGNFLTSLRS